MKRIPKTREKPAPEAQSLEGALRQLRKLRTRQSELENENQRLLGELTALRDEKLKDSLAQDSLFADPEQRKHTQATQAPNQGLLRCIIDSVSDLIFVKDREGVYRGCNKASEWFVGLTEAEQIGKTDFDFFDQELAQKIQETDQQVLNSGQEHCVEEWVPSPDGGQILLESKKMPFYGPDGQAAGIVGISRDITAHKLAENALKKANRELDAFAHTVAHDLRSPLTPIIGYAELLRGQYREQLDQRAIEYLDEIISSGEEMLLLMKDLLSLAVSGQVNRPDLPLDATKIAQKVVNHLNKQLTSAGITVTINELPALRIPKTLLMQLFDNLIRNAMRYGCKTGDIIEVGGERSADHVSLYVRDHGPGIPVEERERVFEVFFRGTTGEGLEGTGIGLATVQKIAKLLDGRAWVEETPGGGCTFWVDMVDTQMDEPDC